MTPGRLPPHDPAIDDHVKRLVAAWPPLTTAQVDALNILFGNARRRMREKQAQQGS